MKIRKKYAILVAVLMLTMLIASSASALTYCSECSSEDVTRLSNTYIPYDYGSCPTSGCEITYRRVYWNYGCNECPHNWGVYKYDDEVHSVGTCPYQ